MLKAHTSSKGGNWSSWNQVRKSKSWIWEEKSGGQSWYSLTSQGKTTFLMVSFFSKTPLLKKGKDDETALFNCQLTPLFNEFPRDLWLSYLVTQVGFPSTPAEAVRIGKWGSIFWLMKIIIMYRWKQREKAKSFHVTLNKEELGLILTMHWHCNAEMVMQINF